MERVIGVAVNIHLQNVDQRDKIHLLVLGKLSHDTSICQVVQGQGLREGN